MNPPITITEDLDSDKELPLREKLEPATPPEEETSPAEQESAEEESTGIFSEALGKYAAETVPLPPVDDLTAQIDEYVTKIGKTLDDIGGSTKYADDAADIVRDANALALVALALGLNEVDSKYKKSASQIIDSAKALAAAKNREEGQKAHVALKTSLTSQSDGKTLVWTDKIADLKPAMKALPNLSSAVQRVSDTEAKLGRVLGSTQSQRVYGQLASLAVIAQGCIPNVAETSKPDAEEDWKKHCEEFRDAALRANAAAHQYAKDKADGKEPSYAAFDASFKAMAESCDSCHKVFYPSAIGKNE